jgi:hypothetical protein
MYIGTISILYHDVNITMGIPSHSVDFKGAIRYCILGFCSMMNVFKIMNYLGGKKCFTSFNHGKGSKVPFHSCPKPH